MPRCDRGLTNYANKEQILAKEIVATNIQQLLSGWLEAERNGVQFPVPFDAAWLMAGYSTKGNAKRKLETFLEAGSDYLSELINIGRGKPVEDIKLTCNALKELCMVSKTEQGKVTRLYFIEAEKKWKLVQQYAPQVASEIEVLQLKAEIAKQEAIARQAEQKTIELRHYVVTVLPEPIQQKILGYTEIKTVEYRDRVVTLAGVNDDSVGITYIQKRFGFKSTKAAWDWLDSIGMGKLSGKWKLGLAAIERASLPWDMVEELDMMASEGIRQIFLGE